MKVRKKGASKNAKSLALKCRETRRKAHPESVGKLLELQPMMDWQSWPTKCPCLDVNVRQMWEASNLSVDMTVDEEIQFCHQVPTDLTKRFDPRVSIVS